MAGAAELVEACADLVTRRQGLDPSMLGDEELRAYVLASDRQLAQLQADHARVVAAADARGVWSVDGDRSCAAWLARKRHRPRPATSAVVGLGRALRHLPEVATALHAGRISLEHARELVRCWRFAPTEFPRWEAEAVAHAEGRPWREFLRLTGHWCTVVDPDGSEDRAAKQFDQRHLLVHRRYDGVVSLHGQLDAIGGEVFLRALAAIEGELWEGDWVAAKAIHGDNTLPRHVARTPAQRRADALRILAERAMALPAGARLPAPSVVVYIDYQTLTGALCELSSGTPLTPGQAASLFAEPAIDLERIVFGPGNRVIELSRRQRCFTGGLRRAILLRDRHCQFPGCEIPAERCHVDHIADYADGGETTQANGRAYCDRHNIIKRRHPPLPPDWTPTDGEDLDDLDDESVDAAIRARILSLVDRAA